MTTIETLRNGTPFDKADIFEQEISVWVKGDKSILIADPTEKINAMNVLTIEERSITAPAGEEVCLCQGYCLRRVHNL